MAETKASSSKTGAKRKAAKRSTATPKAASARRGKASPKSRTRSKAKKTSTSRSGSSNRSSSGGSNGIQAVRDSVGDAGQMVGDAGQKVGRVTGKAASKAKIPLIAGGAAVVGAASGIALTASRSRGGKVLGVKMPKAKVKINSKDLVKSADRVARAGEQIGRLSTGIREIQGTDTSSNGHSAKRSPIEVLIQGLTRRR